MSFLLALPLLIRFLTPSSCTSSCSVDTMSLILATPKRIVSVWSKMALSWLVTLSPNCHGVTSRILAISRLSMATFCWLLVGGVFAVSPITPLVSKTCWNPSLHTKWFYVFRFVYGHFLGIDHWFWFILALFLLLFLCCCACSSCISWYGAMCQKVWQGLGSLLWTCSLHLYPLRLLIVFTWLFIITTNKTKTTVYNDGISFLQWGLGVCSKAAHVPCIARSSRKVLRFVSFKENAKVRTSNLQWLVQWLTRPPL